MKSKSFPFYLSIVALFVGIVSPALFSEGMFMDGLFYATIANNLANGIGSFWELKFTETIFPLFREHPPLAIGLQSIFFRIFGDSIYIERLYSLSSYFITASIIVLIWRESMQAKYHSIAWLPLLFWICIPLVIWAVANNMLENTMMIFTSLAVYFILKSSKLNAIQNIFFAGGMLFLAFLCKGFTSLFPLSAFFWMWLLKHDPKLDLKAMLIKSLWLLLFFLFPFLLLYIFMPKGIESLWSYLNVQVASSLKHIQTVDSRFFIVIRLFKELIPLILLLGIFVWINRKLKINFSLGFRSKNFLFFLLLGLSGVLPIMLSMKQSGFYMLATFPFFAIALSIIIAEVVLALFAKINQQSREYKIFKIVAFAMMSISILIAFSQMGRIGRDKDLLADIYAIIKVVPENSTISIQEELNTNWSLHAYFYRKAKISLDKNKENQHEFLLQHKNTASIDVDYQKLPMKLKKFNIYKIK